jgi:thioredoxin-like negative regulator of GroEL
VPFVVLFKGGKPVDSFLGAKNAAMIQQFLDKNK